MTDFDATTNSDSLNLRDLLQGELHTGNNAGNLTQYLHFERSGTNTIIHISSSGTFTANQNVGAPSALVTSNQDQRIVLTGIDVIGAFTTDQLVIQDLLTRGKLFAD
ncbi:MAG: type I secretion C-terminal target domain-containing protein [Ilumatobacteraceae bacterium]|nr:type I secretion C-terminal target domain-containing protein [Ilumatobacteraceae bacterium]